MVGIYYMNKLVKNKWMIVVYGILLLVGGVLTMVFAITNVGVINRVLSISLAIALFIVGLLNILTALVHKTSEFFTPSLLLGSMAIAMGVVFLINQYLLGFFILYFIAALALAMGAVSIVKFILFAKFKQKGSWIAFYVVLAAVCITLGILIFIYQHRAEQVLYCVVGAVLLLTGVVEVIYGIKAMNKEAKKEE